MARHPGLWTVLAAVFGGLTALAAQSEAAPRAVDSAEAQRRLANAARHLAMERASPHAKAAWQFVGPVRMTGRLTDVEAHPSAPKTIYVASASGGVFKTVDEGKSWSAVFERHASASIGDIAIAPSAPDQVWVGTGEANNLRSSMAGTGVYKSIDGGKTFTYTGLADTQHVARILVHPTDPDVVYVAAAGHEYTHNPERGVFKTTDGGKTWRRVFYRDEKTGVIDLAMNPAEPDTLYAGTANRLRYRWNDPKAGPESGVYKTNDGGATWQPLTNGLPDFAKGEYGRVGVDLCRAKPDTVYAVLDRSGGGRTGGGQGAGRRAGGSRGAELFRSDDAGASWKLVEGNARIRRTFPGYGWFFGQVRADPVDPDVVYVMGLSFHVSTDGGTTWRGLRGSHVDYHAMWINPKDTDHLLVGNDGGLMVSHDRFKSHDHPTNIPIAQAYNCGVGQSEGKFWIYMSCQDHGAWRGQVDLGTGRNDIVRKPWNRGPGDEAGRHAVDPVDPNIVYALSRYGGGPSRTDFGQQAEPAERPAGSRRRRARGTRVAPRFERGTRKRAQWVSPLVISPHDHKRLLYGAQFVFLTDDRGDSWRKISPDLTNVAPERQGNIAHAVVFCVAESAVEKGVIYAGTDDGNVQVTRDEGQTWSKVVAGLPDGRCISSVEASHFDKGVVFITANGKRHDDFQTYVYKSADYGKRWQRLGAEIPGGPANVIKQDAKHRNVLYVGTDRGAYVSTDGGKAWHVLGKNLPTAYVHDLVVHRAEDLAVIATHGRGCWVLDIRDLRRGKSFAP